MKGMSCPWLSGSLRSCLKRAKELQEAREAKNVSAKAAPGAVADLDSASLMKGRVAEVGTSSSKIHTQLTLPEMVPRLEPFAKPRRTAFWSVPGLNSRM